LEPAEKRRIVEAITEEIVVGKEEISVTLCYLPPCKDMAKGWRKGGVTRPFCHLLLKTIRVDSPPFAPNGKALHKLLLERRLEAKLTQEALATRLGVSLRTVKNWERGRNKPLKRFWPGIRFLVAQDKA
jgi:hypothetical protein